MIRLLSSKFAHPAEYRRWALEQLPGHYRWGCYCKPEAFQGDTMLEWINNCRFNIEAKSKVAQMAEANLSGDGLLEGNGQHKQQNT